MKEQRDLAHRVIHEVRFRRGDGMDLELETVRAERLFARALPFDLADPQRVDFHHLFLIEAGVSRHMVDFHLHPVGPGTLLVVRAGQIQAFAAERTIRGWIVIFTPSFLRRRLDAARELDLASDAVLGGGPVVTLGARSNAAATRAAAYLDGVSASPPRRFSAAAISAAFDALVFGLAGLPELSDRTAEREAEDDLVARFFRLLEEHFSSHRSAGFYARCLGVSGRTLDRHLQIARRCTAKQAITARTLLEAKRLLTRRDVQIMAVADELGFSEPQNFTRFFRVASGVSVRAFREAIARPS